MVKFTMKFFMVLMVLFIGVLLGMQQASEGIREMKGIDTEHYKSAFQIETTYDGDIQASVLGEAITSHNIAAKQEKLEEIQAFNFFSEVGATLSEWMTSLFQNGVHSVVNFLDYLAGKLLG